MLKLHNHGSQLHHNETYYQVGQRLKDPNQQYDLGIVALSLVKYAWLKSRPQTRSGRACD